MVILQGNYCNETSFLSDLQKKKRTHRTQKLEQLSYDKSGHDSTINAKYKKILNSDAQKCTKQIVFLEQKNAIEKFIKLPCTLYKIFLENAGYAKCFTVNYYTFGYDLKVKKII